MRFYQVFLYQVFPLCRHSQVGVHPTRCLEFLPEEARSELELLMVEGTSSTDATATLAAAAREILSRPEVVDARETHLDHLRAVLKEGVAEGVVVAVGECGLDYDRLHFCPAAVQVVQCWAEAGAGVGVGAEQG